MNLSPIFDNFFGERLLIELSVAGLLSGGHLLIEGPPGVGKTRLATLLSHAFGLKSNHIQGTPDLMPADILGTHVLQNGKMVFVKGPVFCDILQVDEINRITPRTFAALLEAMQEKSVSLRNEIFPLSKQFHVLATRSTRELEGVYNLPEAALDRFIISLRLSLPSEVDESKIIFSVDNDFKDVVIEGSLSDHQTAAEQIPYSPKILDRCVQIVRQSRQDDKLLLGAGVRASQALLSIGRSLSYVRGEKKVSLDSLKDAVLPVLSHRLKPFLYHHGVKAYVDQYLLDTDPAHQLRQRFGLVDK